MRTHGHIVENNRHGGTIEKRGWKEVEVWGKKINCLPGTMGHTWNPSTLGGQGRQIT